MVKLTDLKSKIALALEKIGTTNGTKPPQSQDPIDEQLHEYNVSAMGESYFKKRRELAKKALLKAFGPQNEQRLTKARARVARDEIAEHVMLISGQFFALDGHVKNGASYVDMNELRVELLKHLDHETVDKIMTNCTKRREPSVTYSVMDATEASV